MESDLKSANLTLTTVSPSDQGLSADGAAPSAMERSSTPDLRAIKEAVPAALPQEEMRTHQAALETDKTGHEHRVSDSETNQHTQQQPVKLVKEKDGHWALSKDGRLVNNLSWVVGFMELANAGDFAANVWNDIPVPVYAIVFMAIGGTVAGVLSVFAFLDSRRACYNVRYLRRQRKQLFEEKQQREARSESTLETDVILALNFRELGIELVARWIMDLLMGFGAVLICVGTYMAIGGANPQVFHASNLLSGYIGNTPIAVFGLCNSMWAGYMFSKAQGHVRATRKVLGSCTATALVKRRARKVQVFSVINGTATILGGVGSMITATMWWGYVILIPVIIASLFCNIWWRKMMGYTRAERNPAMVKEELVYSLEFAATAAAAKKTVADPEAMPQWCSEMPSSLPDMLEFLSFHSLFHQYCIEIMTNDDICQALGGNNAEVTEVSINIEDILALSSAFHPTLLETAKSVARNVDVVHFKNRERYLAELLGTYCALAPSHHDVNTDTESADHREKEVAEKI